VTLDDKITIVIDGAAGHFGFEGEFNSFLF